MIHSEVIKQTLDFKDLYGEIKRNSQNTDELAVLQKDFEQLLKIYDKNGNGQEQVIKFLIKTYTSEAAYRNLN